MPHQARLGCTPLGASLLLYLSSILMVMLVSMDPVEARYLPTRADQTDVEVLKELIRELMNQSNLDQLESRMSMLQQQGKNTDLYYHLLGNQLQLDRRALELPVSSLGDTRQRKLAAV